MKIAIARSARDTPIRGKKFIARVTIQMMHMMLKRDIIGVCIVENARNKLGREVAHVRQTQRLKSIGWMKRIFTDLENIAMMKRIIAIVQNTTKTITFMIGGGTKVTPVIIASGRVQKRMELKRIKEMVRDAPME